MAMDPSTAAALGAGSSSLVTGLLQWYTSNQALEASQKEQQRIARLLNQLQDPTFDRNDINPEDIVLIQKYVPEVAPFIKEEIPKQVQARAQGAIEGRSAQMESLGYMRRLMQQGYDPQTAIEMARAQRAGAAEAASARQTAGAEAARRGFGGGMSFLQAGAGAQAQDRLAMAQQSALADAAQRRMAAAGQAANLGGQIRGEDVALERGNIDIINAYNQRMAAAQQDWANRGADIRNTAQLHNIGEAQRIDELNKMNRYNAAIANRQNRNTIGQQQFQNALSKITGQQSQSALTQQGYLDRAAQTNQALQSVSDLGSKMAGAYYAGEQRQADRDWEREKLNRMYPEKG